MSTSEQRDLFLGIDVGTTGTKALVMDEAGTPVGRGHPTYGIACPLPRRALQDARDWERGATAAVRSACERVDANRIVAMAVSAQGGTLVPVDAQHVPLSPAR